MKNKIFTAGEIVTIQTNLRAIERGLGHSIPGGFIDAYELKDHVLHTGEITTICQNIQSVTGRRDYTYTQSSPTGSNEYTLGRLLFGLLVVFLFLSGALVKILEFIVEWLPF